MATRVTRVVSVVMSGAQVQDEPLTHAIEVDADGYAIRVWCRRVTVASLRGDPQMPPTCPECQRRLRAAREERRLDLP